MKLYSTTKRSIKAARSVEVLPFGELTDAQKEQAVTLANSNGALSELMYTWHAEDVMDNYRYDVEDLAQELTSKYPIQIDTDKLYWESNSQGPYPKWDLHKVFSDVRVDEPDGSGVIDITFSGRGLDVEVYTDVYNEETDSYEEVECTEDELRAYNVPEEAIKIRMDIANAVQEFIDNVWKLVRDVCTEYPNDEWLYDTMEANNIEFVVDGDTVKYYR